MLLRSIGRKVNQMPLPYRTKHGAGGSGVSLTAPVLTWVSGVTDNTPLFEGLFTDLQVGDVGRLQLSTDVGFSSPTDATNTADAAEVLALQLDYTSGALADGQWWARVRHERGASVSSWSNVETKTIATDGNYFAARYFPSRYFAERYFA